MVAFAATHCVEPSGGRRAIVVRPAGSGPSPVARLRPTPCRLPLASKPPTAEPPASVKPLVSASHLLASRLLRSAASAGRAPTPVCPAPPATVLSPTVTAGCYAAPTSTRPNATPPSPGSTLLPACSLARAKPAGLRRRLTERPRLSSPFHFRWPRLSMSCPFILAGASVFCCCFAVVPSCCEPPL